MNISKKLLASLLAVCLIISVLPMSVFAEGTTFQVGESTFDDLQNALDAAAENTDGNKTVTLLRDWTVDKDYTIPEGVTFLIPCKDGDTGYVHYEGKDGFSPDGENPAFTHPTGTLYRTLTIPESCTISVEGILLVNAVTGQNIAGHYDQDVSGGYGQINLNGKIEVEADGLLDASGYIKDGGSGTGSVVIASKGKAFDLYVVPHWRGGTQASYAYFAGIYPMNESKMHNIEVPTTIQQGGTLSGTVKMYASDKYNYTHFPQVDNDNGLFRLTNGSVTKSYESEREKFAFDGDGQFSSSSLAIPQVGQLSTNSYVYPFDGDIDFSFKGMWTADEQFKFMPGATVTLEEDTTLTTTKSVVFYDSTFKDPSNAVGGTQYPSNRGDAKLIMKGGTTLTANGAFGGKITIDESVKETSPATVEMNGAVSVTSKEHNGGFLFGATNSFTFFTTIDGYQLTSGKTYTCWKDDATTVIEVHPESITTQTVEYNGEAHAWEGEAGTYQYKKDAEGATWTSETPTDAGTYFVRDSSADIAESNYKVYTVLGTLTIEPIVAEFALDGDSPFSYDGQAHTVTANVTNKISDDDVTVTLSGDTGTDAQTYTATVTDLGGTAAKNYTVGDNKDLSWEITKAQLTLNWSEPKSFVYNGEEKSVTATLGGVQNNESITVTLSENAKTDVGEYTAEAKISYGETGKASNYTEPTNLTQEWTITQADAPTFDFPTVIGPITYDPNKTLNDVPLSSTSNEYGTFAWTNPQTVPTVDVKSYKVTFTASKETEQNYKEITQTTAMVDLTVNAADQPAPDGLTPHDPTVIDGKGYISGVDETMEYQKQGGDGWTTVTGNTISGLEPGTYLVRYKAKDNYNAGANAEVTVNAFKPGVETRPSAEIDYASEKLTGLESGATYTVNEQAVTAGEDGKIDIDAEWFGEELTIVKKGNGSTTVDSEPQTLQIPARPETPTASNPSAGTILVEGEGTYEYRAAGSGAWTAVPESGRVENLAPGDYEVRVKATDKTFASEIFTVTVEYYYIPAPVTPDRTETTTNPDGSTTTTTTAADGTVTETTEQVDGTVTEKVTEPDGSAVETTTTPEGVTGKVTTDAQGEITAAEVVIPEAKDDEVVTAPVEVPAAKNAEEAPEISVKTGSEDTTKVEIPVTEFGPGTVAVVVHEDGTEEVVRDCVISENGVVLNVEGDVTVKIVENSAEFNDIERVESWAGDAIEFTSARELFSGTGNNNFQPDGEMSRGALVTLLYRLSYEPDAPALKFDDVDENSLYADAIAWADANSIVTGNGNGLFLPDDNITREQLVTLIYNYAKFRGVVKENDGNINVFVDADKVHDYAREAMAWAIGAGIVSGQGNNTLNPTGSTTRAQTAVILMKLCDYMAK